MLKMARSNRKLNSIVVAFLIFFVWNTDFV